MLQRSGISVEREVLHEILSGFLEGSDWVLHKFAWQKGPAIRVVSFGDNTDTKAAFYSTSDKSVSINAAALPFYRGSTLSPEEIGIAFPGIPVSEHPAVSVRQYYESVGVKETVHYLQDNGAPGLLQMESQELLSPDPDNLLGGLSYGPALATLASAAIIFLGIIAALNQLNVAATVVNALLYAVLAVIVGVVVVAVGGGGIGPMAERWRALLAWYDEEKPRVQQTASARGEQLKAQAQDTASQRGADRRGDGGSHPLRWSPSSFAERAAFDGEPGRS
jgi:hypothetical protein